MILIEYGYFRDPEQAVQGVSSTISSDEKAPIIVFGGAKPEFTEVHAEWVAGGLLSEELRVQMHAAARRREKDTEISISVFADLELDMQRFRARRGDVSIRLTPVQMKLLKLLLDNPTVAFSRRELIHAVWDDQNIDETSVAAAMRRLRVALNRGGRPDLIRTIPRFGYALDFEGSL
jgi:two-component system phosphate regulon response regulator PhoB